MCCMGEGKSGFYHGCFIGKLNKRPPAEMMISNVGRLS